MEKLIYSAPEIGVVDVENEGVLCGSSDFEQYCGTDSFEKLF